MQNTDNKWRTLSNPFFYSDTKTNSGIIGSVSGRSKDIMNIIYNDQSAIILSGAPRIGKTALLQYLQTSLQSEAKDLIDLLGARSLETTHFVQIDLTPLESIYQSAGQKEMYTSFLQQCGEALQKVYQIDRPGAFSDLRSLREFLRRIERERSETRCFVILDNIDRLGMDAPAFFQDNLNAKSPQEQGISLLNDCGIIRALTGLVEEFRSFGVILALESLPRARVDAQFTHVSADLAHFATTILQIFTHDDTLDFLSQVPAQFGREWAQQFKALGGDVIFSPKERAWIYEQAGSHPYILQQFCLHTFHFKQLGAEQHDRWQELEEEARVALIEYVKGQIITFLSSMWKRLQEALDPVSLDTRDKFYRFITSLAEKRSGNVISTPLWKELGSEIQYILRNEGIVRFDPLQPVYMPGELLKNYLLQRVAETDAVKTRTPRLLIKIPDQGPGEPIILSELEYRLVKALLLRPKRLPENELMKAGWNKPIDSKTFTQRMYQLRRKLKGENGIEIIKNHYGGFYSLTYPEWLLFQD